MASGDEVVTTTPNPVATKQVAVATAAAAEAAVVAAAESAEPEPPSQVADMVKQGKFFFITFLSFPPFEIYSSYRNYNARRLLHHSCTQVKGKPLKVSSTTLPTFSGMLLG